MVHTILNWVMKELVCMTVEGLGQGVSVSQVRV